MTSTASLRRELADDLSTAAEIEHAVLCQYLYAALSLKKRPEEGGVTWAQTEAVRRWEGQILRVARQEMEHLGIVCNLLTAIGEPPRFERPAMPLPASHYGVGAPFSLEPFSERALVRFVRLEHPAPPDEKMMNVLRPALAANALLAAKFEQEASIAEFYRDLRRKIAATADAFYVGPPSAQIVTQSLKPAPGARTVYDVLLPAVVDRASALGAIDQIIVEGEGGPGADATGHYQTFLRILRELGEETARSKEPFEPARPLVSDPTLGDGAGTRITNPLAQPLAAISDAGYAVTLALLARYYVHDDETDAQLQALQLTAFFPMMTLVIRPIAEMLTQLPAADSDAQRAGPPFAIPRAGSFLPHRQAAWSVLAQELDALRDACAALPVARYPASMQPRLTLMAENTTRLAANFRAQMGLGGAP